MMVRMIAHIQPRLLYEVFLIEHVVHACLMSSPA